MDKHRSLCYSVAASLDGFVAGPQGEDDWIPMDPDIDFGELFGRFDTVLMGRRSWERVIERGEAASGPFGMKTYVASATLKAVEHPAVEILSSDLEQTVRAWKRAPGKDIWLYGGGSLFGSLLAEGLVDSVEVAIVPVLLGRGIPLVDAPFQRRKLALEKHRIYSKSGIALISYSVER